jgi:hypothetical protein
MWRIGSRHSGSVLRWLVILLAGVAMATADPAPTEKQAGPKPPLPPLITYATGRDAFTVDIPHAELNPTARKELSKFLQRPPPIRTSIWTVDLSRRLRLAMVGRPEMTTNRFGQSITRIPLFRLEW